MLKRGALILIVLILLSGVVYSAETGSCKADGKCFPGCINGDPDCSCNDEHGFVCKQGLECTGDLLKNWEEYTCCSVPCTESILVDNNSSAKSLAEIKNNVNNDTVIASKKVSFIPTKQFQYSMVILLFGLIVFVWFISFTLHHFGDEVAFVAKVSDGVISSGKEYGAFLKYEAKKTSELFKNAKKSESKVNIKKEIVKLNPLILKILDTLTGDERETFKLLLDNEGIKKDDLRSALAFDRIQLEQVLLRLERKQVIKKKGGEDNPKIYVHDWLK